jgi:hypothetical protein
MKGERHLSISGVRSRAHRHQRRWTQQDVSSRQHDGADYSSGSGSKHGMKTGQKMLATKMRKHENALR